MEKQRRIDLTYITERIITIFCPPECPEETYLQNLREIIPMLQSKHGHNYMLINLSQKSDTLTRMNHKVLDTGWVDPLAPNLDQILNVCTTMDSWLQINLKHVLVLHCRGGKGLIGVLVASYIHLSNKSASADLSLDHFAMRRFYNDKLFALMTPSQKRHVNGGQTDRLYVVLQPAQLLKGDIMVVCYDKNSRSASRQVIFRLQFHTGLVHGRALTFSKADLDSASEDPRFPEDGKVELLLSDSPDKITGRELWHNGRSVTVDYNTLDPLVRRDSYQDASSLETAKTILLMYCTSVALWVQIQSLRGSVWTLAFAVVSLVAPLHILDSLYATVKKKKTSKEGASFQPTAISLSCSDRTPSASSDSGLSVASQGPPGAKPKRGAAEDKCAQAGKLLPGVEFEIAQSLLEVMTELASSSRGEGEMTGDESGLGHTINGEASSSERETDILDDEDDVAASALDMPSSSSICSLSSDNLPEVQASAQMEYSTHSWVQQQMVEARTENHIPVNGQERSNRARKAKPPPLVAPNTPLRGLSSREAVQRGLGDEDCKHSVAQDTVDNAHASSCQEEEELASLTTDVDESIEQLNQLILDLDPTFVPVPTPCWKQQKQVSDVIDGAGLHSPGWRTSGPQSFRGSPLHSPSFSSSQVISFSVRLT
eukprot:superscaffoldBa00003675_g17468